MSLKAADSPVLSRALWAIFCREWLMQWRQPMEWLNPLCFFIMMIALFPLGVSPEKNLLQLIAPGVIWAGILLSTLLAVENCFKQEYEDGSLDQLLITPHPFFLLLYAKLLVHILLIGLPVILLTPVWGSMLFLDTAQLKVLLITILLGLPTISLMSALGAALTVGLRRGGVLIALLVLPLNIPILIFATAAMQAAAQGMSVQGYFAILGALLVLAVTFLPALIAAALRIMVSR